MPIELLNILADLNEAFIGIARSLNDKTNWGKCNQGFQIRRIKDGSSVEAFVEYEPDDKLSFCWWFEAEILSDGGGASFFL